ncbi:putative acetyltransferase NATA1-like protein [Carex littledalei]|uniref:Putative acetyltransferase NATA1-like protein n=1 Tax=Carex littledalei TaxID=544730 RepID=A0A833RJ19_9POAL|nr:putative acetyltransferase NATA1-like protein [Carex littledalei]
MLPPSAAADSTTVWAEPRHAEPSDVHFLCRMIYQTAEFQRLTHLVSATDSSLISTLFPSPPLPPFFSCTSLVLYLSFTSPSVPSPQTFSVTQFSLPSPITDPNEADFASPLGDGHVIAGFMNCTPTTRAFWQSQGCT